MERKHFDREIGSNIYSPLPYYIAKIIAEIPFFIISTLLHCVVVYNAIDLNSTYSYKYYIFGKHIFKTVLVIFLGGIAGKSFGFFIGAFSPNEYILAQAFDVIKFKFR